MKRILIISILLLSTVMTRAQTAKVSLGVKGTAVAVFPCTEVAPASGIEFGGGGGAFVGMRAYGHFGLQAEMLYGYRTAWYTSSTYTPQTLRSDRSYLFVPVVLQGWVSRSVALELGYEQAIALSATFSDGYRMKEDSGVLDYGSLIAGVSVNVGSRLYFNMRYSLAVTDSHVMTVQPSREMGVTFGVGVRLYNSRKSVFVK